MVRVVGRDVHDEWDVGSKVVVGLLAVDVSLPELVVLGVRVRVRVRERVWVGVRTW